MKLRLAALAAALALPLVVLAQPRPGLPCVSGTLAQYISLGRMGCTSDGGEITFSNFSYTLNTTGIPASAISVTPSLAPGGFSALSFSAAWRASAGATIGATINYSLTVRIFAFSWVIIEGPSMELQLGKPKVNGVIGSVAVTEGSPSTPVPPSPPAPAPVWVPLRVYETCADVCSEQLVATGGGLKLPASVSDTIKLSGGSDGVSFSSFTASYRINCSFCYVN